MAKKPIDAIFNQAYIDENRRLNGYIFADSKERFKDGDFVTTSRVTVRNLDVIFTANSVYFVSTWADGARLKNPVQKEIERFSTELGVTKHTRYKIAETETDFERFFEIQEEAADVAAKRLYRELMAGLVDPDPAAILEYKKQVDLVLRWNLFQKAKEKESKT